MLDKWIVETDAFLSILNPEYNPSVRQEFTRDYTYEKSITIRNEQESKIKNG